MAGIYEWIDENIAQGLLPGGVSPAEGIIAQTVGGALGGAMAPWGPAGAGGTVPFFGAPAAGAAMPAMGAMRGRTITEVYTVYPNGVKELKSVTPGGVKLYARDVTAAKRTRKVGRLVNRLFPTRRRKTARRK